MSETDYNILTAIIAIIGGSITVSSIIFSQKNNGKELLKKIIPIQNIIGVFLLFWGISGLVQLAFNTSLLIHASLIFFLSLFTSIAEVGVGFLLAFGLISYLTEKSTRIIKASELLKSKFLKIQIPAGIFLIILGICELIALYN